MGHAEAKCGTKASRSPSLSAHKKASGKRRYQTTSPTTCCSCEAGVEGVEKGGVLPSWRLSYRLIYHPCSCKRRLSQSEEGSQNGCSVVYGRQGDAEVINSGSDFRDFIHAGSSCRFCVVKIRTCFGQPDSRKILGAVLVPPSCSSLMHLFQMVWLPSRCRAHTASHPWACVNGFSMSVCGFDSSYTIVLCQSSLYRRAFRSVRIWFMQELIFSQKRSIGTLHPPTGNASGRHGSKFVRRMQLESNTHSSCFGGLGA